MSPCLRVVSAGWCTLAEVSSTVTRQQVIMANEWLDAEQEAAEAK